MIPLENLTVGNAGGMVKTLADVARFCNSAVTRITVGSITKLERIGNGTRMLVRTKFLDVEQMERMLGMGMQEGMSLALGQIDALLHEAVAA